MTVISSIDGLRGRDESDSWHSEFVERVNSEIQSTSEGKPISHGQAQKPVNVFMKAYIDWADSPNLETANRLRKHLHVPLDSVVMKCVKYHFPESFRESSLKISSLSSFDRSQYYSRQQCLRKICPQKPLLIDVFWAVKRFHKVLETVIEQGQNT